MAWIELYEHQKRALDKMHNGCILCGDVGSGKSRTAIAYYYKKMAGDLYSEDFLPMIDPADLIIITTAKKRDSLDWDNELRAFNICRDPKIVGLYNHEVVVDSWNNIKKYADRKDSFFIFDEQRVVGSGAWVNAFIKIAKNNQWILLSATPGDKWLDYIPVMVANGFYKNRSSFEREHVVYNPYVSYKQVAKYMGEKKLRIIRNYLLVEMPMTRKTERHDIDIWCNYNPMEYRSIMKNRWNHYSNKPVENISELCTILRKCVNSDPSRCTAVKKLLEKHDRLIIFYNFDYELEMLHSVCDLPWLEVAEWNGHRHDILPTSKRWVYLVQYMAGSEGWNCITADAIIFFSQTYSYRTLMQACGRIDRLNTPYKDLYYYHLKSKAPIDLAISRALKQKRMFNASKFVKIKI